MLLVRIVIILVLAAAAVPAQTRFAGIEVNRAFREYHLTKSSMKGFDEERARIEEDPRHEQVAKLTEEAKQAALAIGRIAPDDAAAKLAAQRIAELKRDELQALTNALREGRNNRTNDLNQRLVATTRKLLDTVHAIAAEVGKERGFDAVIDSSGHTNTGLPFVLYARNLPDLTGEVIARLNKDTAAPTPAGTTPAVAGPKPPQSAPTQAGDQRN
jgi:Skp family chaperone for outer membrane proteins